MRQIFLIFLCLPLVTWHIASYSQGYAPSLSSAPPETRRIDGNNAWKVYKLKNSQVILSLHKPLPNPSSLFLSKDGGNHWRNLIFSNNFNVNNVYISEKNYIYVMTQGWAGEGVIWLLYESRDEGESWKVIRQFTMMQKFSCGSIGQLVVTDNRVYCIGINYSSKYDSSDQGHLIELNGKVANVSFKNEMEAAAFTSDGVYLSKDGGVNWTFKGKFFKSNLPYPWALDTRQQSGGGLLWQGESLQYISDDKIIYTNDSLRLVQGLLYNNGIFSPYFEQKYTGPGGEIIFFPIDNFTYLVTNGNDMFKSIDGGISWNKLNLPAAFGDHYRYFTDIKVDEFKNLYFISGVSHGNRDSTSWLFVTTNLIT